MKRAGVVAIVAGAVVLAGVVIGIVSLSTNAAGPEEAAQSYLSALAAGDGESAAELIVDSPRNESELAAALDTAASLITSPEVLGVESSDAAATATFTFLLEGENVEGTLSLVETDDGWGLTPDALGVIVPTAQQGDSVMAAGTLVLSAATVVLLPAVYSVSAAPVDLLEGTVTARVTPGSTVGVSAPAEVSAEAIVAVQEQLDSYADSCAASVDDVPNECGIRVPWGVDLASLDRIAFEISSYPAVEISDDGGSFRSSGGVIVATATGTTRNGETQSFTYRSDDWAMQGTVQFIGNEMVLSVF
ncbi:hypothetical protein [Microbacterium sp. NPDC076911]|uniref:hypothetical protein n=1 Tax=Microbacterium sp. NPDC076911 TaxID=3154958 RepID=UPI00343DA71D